MSDCGRVSVEPVSAVAGEETCPILDGDTVAIAGLGLAWYPFVAGPDLVAAAGLGGEGEGEGVSFVGAWQSVSAERALGLIARLV